MSADPPELIAAKKQVRADAKARRAVAFARADETTGDRLRDAVLGAIDLAPGAVIGCYWPFRDEIDCAPLLRHLHGAGHEIGLPVIVGKGRPLVFRAWRPEMRLAKGRLGEPVPPPDADYGAGDLEPSVLFVPLLAFDRTGYRIGYGGGYYDLTIDARRASGEVLAVGLAFAAQEVEFVPRGPNDQPLDRLVTETGEIALTPES